MADQAGKKITQLNEYGGTLPQAANAGIAFPVASATDNYKIPISKLTSYVSSSINSALENIGPGATGPAGPQGPQGPKGDTGGSNPIFVSDYTATDYRHLVRIAVTSSSSANNFNGILNIFSKANNSPTHIIGSIFIAIPNVFNTYNIDAKWVGIANPGTTSSAELYYQLSGSAGTGVTYIDFYLKRVPSGSVYAATIEVVANSVGAGNVSSGPATRPTPTVASLVLIPQIGSGGGGSSIPLPVSIADGGTGKTTRGDAAFNLFQTAQPGPLNYIYGDGGEGAGYRSATSFIADNKLLKADPSPIATGSEKTSSSPIDTSAKLVRWTVTANNQILHINPDHFIEGEIIWVRVKSDSSTSPARDGAKIRSYISSSNYNDIAISYCLGTSYRLIMLVKGNLHLELAAELFASSLA